MKQFLRQLVNTRKFSLGVNISCRAMLFSCTTLTLCRLSFQALNHKFLLHVPWIGGMMLSIGTCTYKQVLLQFWQWMGEGAGWTQNYWSVLIGIT